MFGLFRKTDYFELDANEVSVLNLDDIDKVLDEVYVKKIDRSAKSITIKSSKGIEGCKSICLAIQFQSVHLHKDHAGKWWIY